MDHKIKTAALLFILYLSGQTTLRAEDQPTQQEINTQEIRSEQTKTENIAPKENIKIDSSVETKANDKKQPIEKSATKSNENQSTEKISEKPSKKQQKKTEGKILKNPELIGEFRESYFDENPVDHVVSYLLYGLVSGGIMGLGGGLSFYTTSTNLSPLFISAGAVGAAGAITGVILALIENTTHNPFFGNDFLKYTWYGVLGGAMVGGLAGLVPYLTTNNPVTILNWVGYGAYAGIGAGIALFFILPKSSLKNLIIDTNPVQSKIGYRYMF